MPRRLTLACLAVLIAACEDQALPTDPLQPGFNPGASAAAFSVMSRNIYVGADLDAVIAALLSPDPTDDGPALAATIATLQATDFGARAVALAREVAQHRPMAIGLQEVSTITLPTAGGPVVLDYLAGLQAALAAAGLDYTVVASIVNVDVQIPVAPGVAVGLVDRDVLLVRGDVPVLGATQGNYQAEIPLGFTTLRRGWVSADLHVAGRTVRVVSTHPESGPGLSAVVREAQVTELMSLLSGWTGPLAVIGDMNGIPGSASYNVLASAGLVDAWESLRPGELGLTCCHTPDLSNPTAAGFDQRLDQIFVRNGFLTGNGGVIPASRVQLTGANPAEKVAGPLYPIWPSDHAGIVAGLLFGGQ